MSPVLPMVYEEAKPGVASAEMCKRRPFGVSNSRRALEVAVSEGYELSMSHREASRNASWTWSMNALIVIGLVDPAALQTLRQLEKTGTSLALQYATHV